MPGYRDHAPTGDVGAVVGRSQCDDPAGLVPAVVLLRHSRTTTPPAE
jgi:hypothetical protein